MTGLDYIELVIPMDLPNPLNGTHGAWSRSAKQAKKQRQHVREYIMLHRLQGLKDVREVQLTRLAKKQYDQVNHYAALKHVQDEVALSLGVDDAEWRAGAMQWQFLHEQSSKYGLKITYLLKPKRYPPKPWPGTAESSESSTASTTTSSLRNDVPNFVCLD